MDIAATLKWIEATALATSIRDSLFLFPMLESIHVIGLALVFGMIFVLDLRMLGLASSARPFEKVARDVLRWTWAGFATTLLTGSLMFTTNAGVYFNNSYFRAKMLLLAAAGINMAIFELTLGKRVLESLHDSGALHAALADVSRGLLLHGHLHRRIHQTLPTSSGHIDAVGEILERHQTGEWETVWFSCTPEHSELLVEKGSIAVDGVSLTVVDVRADRFSVMLIPHTREHTTLGLKKPGSPVNLEFDLIAKHVQKLFKKLNITP